MTTMTSTTNSVYCDSKAVQVSCTKLEVGAYMTHCFGMGGGLTCTENVKFRRVVSEIYEPTDIPTDGR